MRKTFTFLPLKRMSWSKSPFFRGISVFFPALAAAFFPAHAKPAFGFKFDGSLDKEAISKAYQDHFSLEGRPGEHDQSDRLCIGILEFYFP